LMDEESDLTDSDPSGTGFSLWVLVGAQSSMLQPEPTG
jgi:hypothetical protein